MGRACGRIAGMLFVVRDLSSLVALGYQNSAAITTGTCAFVSLSFLLAAVLTFAPIPLASRTLSRRFAASSGG